MIDLNPKLRERLDGLVSRINGLKEREFINRELFVTSTYLLKNPGKLLRPTLVFTGAEILNDENTDYTDLAAGIELLHVSSLIHDDIIDKSATRRGVKAVHVAFNPDAALLAGDALISKAILLVSKYGTEVIEKISSAAMEMCAGELLDSKLANKPVTLDQYITISQLKSASLIGTSLSIVGTYLHSPLEPNLDKIGRYLGVAFQIRDDVLDFLEGENAEALGSIVINKRRKARINTRDEVKKAIKLNNKFVKIAEGEANNLPENEGKKLLLENIHSVLLDENML